MQTFSILDSLYILITTRKIQWNKNLEKIFGAKRNTVRSWRYNQRQPSIKEAKKIILRTGGRLDFESIYGPLEEVE